MANTRTVRQTATQAVPQQEQDVRLRMLNSFLSCPHRDTEKIKKIHADLQQKDPLFYSHLASWYRKNGELRDHNEVFSAMLITDSYLENREVGLGLFRDSALFMKKKILGFLKGKTVKLRQKTGKKITVKGKKKPIDEVKIEEKKVGLFKNPPTAFKKEVETFLKHIEKDNDKFDSIALANFNDMKSLYASLHIKPSKRSNDILFKEKFPKSSKLNIFKEIQQAKTPEEQATLIVKNKIPYTVAVGLIEKMSPSIMVALINSMTPQQLINNIASLEERGAMENEGTKKLIDDKLKRAETSKNVTALKSKQANKTGRIKSEALSAQLDKIADTQIKRKGVINVPTAILIDRSGSMNVAIESGKHCAAMVSGASEADVYVVVFDSMPMEIISKEKTLTGWENAFRPVRPGGRTSIGCGVELLRNNKYYVEQIVVITDGGENADPMFSKVYERYSEELKVRPSVVMIKVPGDSDVFSENLKKAGIEFDEYSPDGDDYYGLPGLIPLLSRKSKLDLLMEIMATPLVTRRPLIS